MGGSPYSNAVTLQTPALNAPPPAPATASVTRTSSTKLTLTIAWADVPGESGFRIVRETLGTNKTWGGTVSYNLSAGAKNYTQTVTAGRYRYAVRAVNGTGLSAATPALCTTTGGAGTFTCETDGSITVR